MSQIIKSTWSCNDDMGSLVSIFEVSFVLFKRYSTKVASIPQLWFLEVTTYIGDNDTQSFEIFIDLMSQLPSVAGNDGLVWFITLTFGKGNDLIEDGNDKDCCFSHAGLGLAEYVLPLECEWDGFHLHFAGMLESTLSDGSFKFVFKEELIPTCEIGSLILFVDVLFRFFLIRALIFGHDISHSSLLI